MQLSQQPLRVLLTKAVLVALLLLLLLKQPLMLQVVASVMLL
jgi:hypothetical protein